MIGNQERSQEQGRVGWVLEAPRPVVFFEKY